MRACTRTGRSAIGRLHCGTHKEQDANEKPFESEWPFQRVFRVALGKLALFNSAGIGGDNLTPQQRLRFFNRPRIHGFVRLPILLGSLGTGSQNSALTVRMENKWESF